MKNIRCILITTILTCLLHHSTSLPTSTEKTHPIQKNHDLTTQPSSSSSHLTPPIVYTIAGSDSGGGAGIQADLRAIHSMGGHGCTAITCLTAQNSMGVSKDGIHAPPSSFLREQLDVLVDDLYPRAVKVGMLGTTELAVEVGRFLKELKSTRNQDERVVEPPFVVVDPVMVATSGAKLITDGVMEAMIQHVFPYADILTPNKFEAEALLGRKLLTYQDIEQGAKELLKMGAKSVLIKGGHSLIESSDATDDDSTCNEEKSSHDYAQDYFVSNGGDNADRLSDSSLGVWIRGFRIDTIHTHGTGCTLSSSIASALAIGHQQREIGGNLTNGAKAAIHGVDACVLGKAYISAGIAKAVKLGEGPGPVAQTEFPDSSEFFPSIVQSPSSPNPTPFLPMQSFKSMTKSIKPTLGPILPVVDTLEWVQQLAVIEGITDIQLRIKNESDPLKIQDMVEKAQAICVENKVRLWINDYWEAAMKAKTFGVHMGQEDLKKCVDNGGLEELRKSNLALGISTHSYSELAAALGVRPTYISLGPVFGTSSKDVAFNPQGLETVKKWKNLITEDMPLVAIGGIGDADAAESVKEAGADCIAIIGAVTKADDVKIAVQDLIRAMA